MFFKEACAMKSKVTLTIDKELIPIAKYYARSHGRSLSQLIETSLREMSAADEKPFSGRWKGKFKKSGKTELRYAILAKRYF